MAEVNSWVCHCMPDPQGHVHHNDEHAYNPETEAANAAATAGETGCFAANGQCSSNAVLHVWV